MLGSMITAAPEMLKVAKTVERVATAGVSVMLLGASGTGKELLARAVHEKSARSGGAFVAINCAAIPENLLESELFGYERSLARRVKATSARSAAEADLFFDEVATFRWRHVKAALLHDRDRGSAAAILSGRNPHRLRDPPGSGAMIARGLPRDLIPRRLGEGVVIPVVPSGRPTRSARAPFRNLFAREMNPKVQGLSPDALAAIDGYAWPGNVRELENRIKRAVIMTDARMITAEDLDLPGRTDDAPATINLRAAREVADRRAIRQAMSRTENNISSAAKLLGISRPTLYDLIKQYQLQA